ncbi:MAG: DUF4097 family beta strand repeat-containing protein [Acidobacteriota bacterium]|nr:DUF4097 family beta strand repeat-containing protein [Acidobacteriota bacterium]
MTLQIRRPALAAAVALFAATALGACEMNLHTEGLSSRDTRTFKVTGAPELVLDTFDGAIEVHSWDRNEVEVEIERRAMAQPLIDQMTVEVEQKGDRIVVRVTGPARTDFRGVTIGMHISPTARLRVAVPRATNLEAKSGDGSIRVEALDGKLVLNTVDGSVTGVRVTGDIQIRTGDGSIKLEDAAGKLDLETDDGSIGIDAKPTALHAKTGDGTIRVNIDPDSAMTADWDFTTGDGNVVLTLPSRFNAELDLETASGAVRIDQHPLLKDVAGEGRRDGENSDERRERRRSLRAKMGDGGKILKVRTGDGWIRIER